MHEFCGTFHQLAKYHELQIVFLAKAVNILLTVGNVWQNNRFEGGFNVVDVCIYQRTKVECLCYNALRYQYYQNLY